MQDLGSVLLQARQQLEIYQASRAKCIQACRSIRDRNTLANASKFLSLGMGEFRLRADELFLTVSDVFGDDFANKPCTGTPPVDMFFGKIMRIPKNAPAATDFPTELRKLYRTGHRFMRLIDDAVEHSSAAKMRLSKCKSDYECSWQAMCL